MTPIDRAGRARFCDSCRRPVYDSRALTQNELGDLIATQEGRRLPCVRLHRRSDGTIVTRDCFAPVVRAGRFLWLKVGVAATLFWTAVVASTSWTRRPDASVIQSEGRAETNTRKLPFILRPPEETPTPRIARKRRSLDRIATTVTTVTITLGAMRVGD